MHRGGVYLIFVPNQPLPLSPTYHDLSGQKVLIPQNNLTYKALLISHLYVLIFT
jgi:hypothetical protein